MMNFSTQRGVLHTDETLDSELISSEFTFIIPGQSKEGLDWYDCKRRDGKDDNERFCKETLQEFATG